jgi:hypothetical protein
MKHVALTGISRDAIEDLMRKRLRTFELRSAHNIPVVLEAKIGEEIFITDASRNDIAIGTTGIVARIRDKSISMIKVAHSIGDVYEEREIMSARIQVELRAHTCKVRGIDDRGPGTAITVETTEIAHKEGR